MNRKGVILVNLGSPDSPKVGDVRRYLREFLMDGRVLVIGGTKGTQDYLTSTELGGQ